MNTIDLLLYIRDRLAKETDDEAMELVQDIDLYLMVDTSTNELLYETIH